MRARQPQYYVIQFVWFFSAIFLVLLMISTILKKVPKINSIVTPAMFFLLFMVFFNNTGKYTYDFRLANGHTQYEGRLEVRRNQGPWGTFHGCSWTTLQASLACSALDFSSSVVLPPTFGAERFGTPPTDMPVHLLISTCVASDQVEVTTLFDCNHRVWDDSAAVNDHSCDVEIACMPGKKTRDFSHFR